MLKFYHLLMGACLLLCLIGAGCSSVQQNEGNMAKYPVALEEAAWIVEGEPIEFDGQWWYPQDGIDVLLDSEVVLRGEYKGVQFFTAKADVKPFHRLYTKFGRHKFRMYKAQHDPR